MAKEEKKKSFFGSIPVLLILGLLAFRWTIVEPYVVPTGSMEPTLKTGDRLYALKCAYDVKIPFTEIPLFRTGQVKRGDVILFRAPRDPNVTYVKRAIGLPGDKLEFRQGVLFVNGEEIKKEIFPNRNLMYDIEEEGRKRLYVENLTGKRHYVILDSYFDERPSRSSVEITVPSNHLFAVGDNRDNSYDSRMWGFVPMEYLKGKAMFIWYSSWDKNLAESMRTNYALPEMIWRFFIEFFQFFIDLGKGDAWIRYERVGTFIQ